MGLIQESVAVSVERPAILVFAGDHGVVAEGVSAYPQDVTWQMVENFLSQGAAINVFARQSGCALKVIDAGVNHDFGSRAFLVDRKIDVLRDDRQRLRGAGAGRLGSGRHLHGGANVGRQIGRGADDQLQDTVEE